MTSLLSVTAEEKNQWELMTCGNGTKFTLTLLLKEDMTSCGCPNKGSTHTSRYCGPQLFAMKDSWLHAVLQYKGAGHDPRPCMLAHTV